MDSRIKIHSHWLSELGKDFPESADQLGILAEHLFAKQEKLAALVRYCAAHPELPMMRMYAEYSAALDAVELESPVEIQSEVSEEEASKLSPRDRAARTKKLRTRTKTIAVAVKFILEGEAWTLVEVAEKAGVGIATVHTHFRNRNRVLVAAYNQLLTDN
jgi:hypothetical protein